MTDIPFRYKVNMTELITKYLSMKVSIDFFDFYELVSEQLMTKAEKQTGFIVSKAM